MFVVVSFLGEGGTMVFLGLIVGCDVEEFE
jgi:hypothetical protein